MIDSLQVTYGFTVGRVSFNELMDRISSVVSSHKADFDLRVTSNSITAKVYPFQYKGAKDISEKDGAEIMRSLIYLFENCIDGGVLWSVDMASALPF